MPDRPDWIPEPPPLPDPWPIPDDHKVSATSKHFVLISGSLIL